MRKKKTIPELFKNMTESIDDTESKIDQAIAKLEAMHEELKELLLLCQENYPVETDHRSIFKNNRHNTLLFLKWLQMDKDRVEDPGQLTLINASIDCLSDRLGKLQQASF